MNIGKDNKLVIKVCACWGYMCDLGLGWGEEVYRRKAEASAEAS